MNGRGVLLKFKLYHVISDSYYLGSTTMVNKVAYMWISDTISIGIAEALVIGFDAACAALYMKGHSFTSE